MLKINREALSLVVRSADNHLRLFKPSAEKEEPKLYAGKVESTILTMLLDIFGIGARDVSNGPAAFRATNAFNQLWRAYDQVIDVDHPAIDIPVTEEELDNTIVYHQYAGRNVSGIESRLAAQKAFLNANPDNDASSVRRRERFSDLLLAYRKQVADTANNPNYHRGEILDYSTALQAKKDLTGFLGTVGASLCALCLDRDDPDTVEFFNGVIFIMQFGDDLLDWRKDMQERNETQRKSTGQARPIENLLVATLAENQTEMNDCREHLADKERRSFLWLEKLAPKTWDEFQSRFQTQVDNLPPHRHGERTKGILELTFNKILPIAPESGWFYRWAKY